MTLGGVASERLSNGSMYKILTVMEMLVRQCYILPSSLRHTGEVLVATERSCKPNPGNPDRR